MKATCWSCYRCVKRSSRASNGGGSGVVRAPRLLRERFSEGEGSTERKRSSSGFDSEVSFLERKMSSLEMEGNQISSASEELKSPGLEEVFFELAPGMPLSVDLEGDCLGHVYQVLGHHHQYLEAFLAFHNYMLHAQCPLPREHRHYLAIMAASRHNCSFLVEAEISEFLSVGGPKEWLTGLDHAPSIFMSLKEINKLMAHRPWLLTADHIKKVMSGGDNWALSSLGHAIMILGHFHALSSFVLASGITVVKDEEVAESSSSGSEGDCLSTSSDIEVDSIVTRMKRLGEGGVEVDGKTSADELLQNYRAVEAQSSELSFHQHRKYQQQQQSVSCFNDDSEYRYQDFSCRADHDSISALQAGDYSWQDHGFCFSNLLLQEAGDFLDRKFNTAQSLTYRSMGNMEGVDTSKFRQAIWNMVQCLFGIRHDDYNYKIIDHLLDRKTKIFIKMAACQPENVNNRLYNIFNKQLKLSEKIQINIIIMEARLQAEILYVTRAISQYRSYGL